MASPIADGGGDGGEGYWKWRPVAESQVMQACLWQFTTPLCCCYSWHLLSQLTKLKSAKLSTWPLMKLAPEDFCLLLPKSMPLTGLFNYHLVRFIKLYLISSVVLLLFPELWIEPKRSTREVGVYMHGI